jgi:hypothetical protein
VYFENDACGKLLEENKELLNLLKKTRNTWMSVIIVSVTCLSFVFALPLSIF